MGATVGLKPIKLSQIEREKPEWIWRDRIPAKVLTGVCGLRGVGKGVFSAHVAADVSNRRGLNPKRYGRVLVSAHEDAPGVVVRPRYEAAGANLDNVMFQRFRLSADSLSVLNLATCVFEEKIDLVIIDPLASHLDGVSRYNDSLRQVIDPLNELVAEACDCAVLIVEHPIKRISRSMDPLTAIAGKPFIDAARMILLLGEDPQDPERRVLATVKHNICVARPTVAFETDIVEVPEVDEQPRLLAVPGEVEVDPIDLLIKAGGTRGRPPEKLYAAVRWLAQLLYHTPMPIRAQIVYEEAEKHGHTRSTLLNARKRLKVVVDPPTGKDATWALAPEMRAQLDADAAAQDPVAREHADPGGPSLVTITDEDIAKWLAGGEQDDDDDEPEEEDDDD